MFKLFAILSLLVLAGCGMKGSLELPPERQPPILDRWKAKPPAPPANSEASPQEKSAQ